MYIEPFWCGVIATILFELFLVILIAMISMPKAGGKGKDEKNNS
jgi:hypothetical protein